MTWILKIRRCFLISCSLSVLYWAGKSYRRYHEIRNFFRDPDDLAWASAYVDRPINFCDAPWKATIALNSDEAGKEIFVSPSGRYQIEPIGGDSKEAYFFVIDNKIGRKFKNTVTPFLNEINFKWTADEHFLIFTTPITKDDWDPAEVFINETSTGKALYLGESMFYDCGMRNW